MRLKRDYKEGEDYFLSSGLRQSIRPSVNLPGGLRSGYKYEGPSYPHLIHYQLRRDFDIVVGQLL